RSVARVRRRALRRVLMPNMGRCSDKVPGASAAKVDVTLFRRSDAASCFRNDLQTGDCREMTAVMIDERHPVPKRRCGDPRIRRINRYTLDGPHAGPNPSELLVVWEHDVPRGLHF